MKFLILVICFASANAFAVTASDIQASQRELARACGQSGVDRPGSVAASECAAASRQSNTVSRQLNLEISESLQRRDQERQRIQQDEAWREQVRRGNRY